MLNENIKAVRQSKGLSQEELAIKLNVVRQTVSKWERGLSVPDSEMLITISDALETPVSTLLGEKAADSSPADVRELSEKLEIINLQLARQKASRRKILYWTFIAACVIIVLIFIAVFLAGNVCLEWDYGDPETAVVGTAVHAFVWIFVRIAPFIFICSFAGAVMTRKRN